MMTPIGVADNPDAQTPANCRTVVLLTGELQVCYEQSATVEDAGGCFIASYHDNSGPVVATVPWCGGVNSDLDHWSLSAPIIVDDGNGHVYGVVIWAWNDGASCGGAIISVYGGGPPTVVPAYLPCP